MSFFKSDVLFLYQRLDVGCMLICIEVKYLGLIIYFMLEIFSFPISNMQTPLSAGILLMSLCLCVV